MNSPLVLNVTFNSVQLFSKQPTGFKVQNTFLSSTNPSESRQTISINKKQYKHVTFLTDPRSVYLWLTISTVPYCSIQSLPRMMLCTQQKGLVHVYASLCLWRHTNVSRQLPTTCHSDIGRGHYWLIKENLTHTINKPFLKTTGELVLLDWQVKTCSAGLDSR